MFDASGAIAKMETMLEASEAGFASVVWPEHDTQGEALSLASLDLFAFCRGAFTLVATGSWSPALGMRRLIMERILVVDAIASRPRFARRYLSSGFDQDGKLDLRNADEALSAAIRRWPENPLLDADEARNRWLETLRDDSVGVHPSPFAPRLHTDIEGGILVFRDHIIKTTGGAIAIAGGSFDEALGALKLRIPESQAGAAVCVQFAVEHLGFDLDRMVRETVEDAERLGLLSEPDGEPAI